MVQSTKPSRHVPETEDQDLPDWEKHLKWITPVIAVILLVSAGYLWMRNRNTDLRTQVAYDYHQAQTVTELEAVANAYPDEPEAALAELRAAQLRYDSGDMETAREQYRNFLDLHPKHPLAANARWGYWMSTEAVGNLDEALEGFSSVSEGDLLYPESLMARARVLEKLDRDDEALDLYGRIREEFADSAWAERARVMSEQLEVDRRRAAAVSE